MAVCSHPLHIFWIAFWGRLQYIILNLFLEAQISRKLVRPKHQFHLSTRFDDVHVHDIDTAQLCSKFQDDLTTGR